MGDESDSDLMRHAEHFNLCEASCSPSLQILGPQHVIGLIQSTHTASWIEEWAPPETYHTCPGDKTAEGLNAL